MTSAGKDPRGEKKAEAKDFEVVWEATEESSGGGQGQGETKKEEQDLTFIHRQTTEEPRRRYVFDNRQAGRQTIGLPALYAVLTCRPSLAVRFTK